MSFPETAPLPAPLMVVTHGAGNTPESMCDVFRLVVGDRLVLLCPAGPRIRAGEEGRYYPDHFALEKIVFASVAAVTEAFPGQVDGNGAIYSGYSQGATMGALMIPAHGKDFPLLALVEGGVEGWTPARARQYAGGGGQRVLFACGTPHCRKHAEKVGETLRKAGLEAQVVYAEGEGHTYGGRVAYATARAFDWLVGNDPRYASHNR